MFSNMFSEPPIAAIKPKSLVEAMI